MAKLGVEDRSAKRKRKAPVLYLREWLTALDLQQGKIALEASVNEGYVSQLVNREKYPEESPRTAMVKALADAMGVPWLLLFELPPPDPVPMDVIARYPPALLRRVAAARARARLTGRSKRSA